MPEMRFTIRWPDGTQEDCYSPSLVVKEHLTPGESYPLAEFLERSRTALAIGSGRVEAKFGFPCSRALNQIARIEASGERFAGTDNAVVQIMSFRE